MSGMQVFLFPVCVPLNQVSDLTYGLDTLVSEGMQQLGTEVKQYRLVGLRAT